MEEGVDSDRSLAHVDETLCYTHNEQAVWLLVIVARQLSKHLSETRIVRACADKTHGKDGVEGDLEVVIMAVLRERVENGELRI